MIDRIIVKISKVKIVGAEMEKWLYSSSIFFYSMFLSHSIYPMAHHIQRSFSKAAVALSPQSRSNSNSNNSNSMLNVNSIGIDSIEVAIEKLKQNKNTLAQMLDGSGNTLLHLAVQETKKSLVKDILTYIRIQHQERDVDIQIPPYEHFGKRSYVGCYTPLHLALRLPASKNKNKIIALLLAAGADKRKPKLTPFGNQDPETPEMTLNRQSKSNPKLLRLFYPEKQTKNKSHKNAVPYSSEQRSFTQQHSINRLDNPVNSSEIPEFNQKQYTHDNLFQEDSARQPVIGQISPKPIALTPLITKSSTLWKYIAIGTASATIAYCIARKIYQKKSETKTS